MFASGFVVREARFGERGGVFGHDVSPSAAMVSNRFAFVKYIMAKDSATWLEVGEEGASQRVDNYLTRILKGVPKSHIYRILRSGEVRVNSGRIGAEYKVEAGDVIRIPPVRFTPREEQ